MRRTVACLSAIALAACASAGSPGDSGKPPLSVAWDAGEGVRYLVVSGCIPAVAENLDIKTAVDRGGGLSRVRKLDASPLANDPVGTPAYALVSGASIVMTGTAERCRVASASGEAATLRQRVLDAIAQQGSWITVSPPANAADAGFDVDARCRPHAGGALLLTMMSARASPLPFQAIVSRASAAACTV